MLARYALLAPANDNCKTSYLPREAVWVEALSDKIMANRTRIESLPYAIKCDDCKATIRRTSNVQESYQGGTCDRCKARRNVKRFEIGRTYMMRSPGDHNCVWTYKVVALTAKQVTLTGHGKTIKRGIKIYNGIEMCMPLGTYSLAPCLTAEKETK